MWIVVPYIKCWCIYVHRATATLFFLVCVCVVAGIGLKVPRSSGTGGWGLRSVEVWTHPGQTGRYSPLANHRPHGIWKTQNTMFAAFRAFYAARTLHLQRNYSTLQIQNTYFSKWPVPKAVDLHGHTYHFKSGCHWVKFWKSKIPYIQYLLPEMLCFEY